MNYKLIQDETELNKFIRFLPNCEEGEQYYIALFSRKKYDLTGKLGLKSDKSQLKRVTSTKDRIIQKIKQMETVIGTYQHDNKPIPNEVLALYITPNPRDLTLASKNTCKELMELIFNGNKHFNPKSIALNHIQKACSKKIWFDFEMDAKNYELDPLKKTIEAFIGSNNYQIIETRGGYHILIKLDAIPETHTKIWFNNMKKLHDIDQTGDLLLPIPGCCQGNFIPKLV